MLIIFLVWMTSIFAQSLELQNFNTVIIRTEITEESVDRTIKEIASVPGKEVVLYIYSPGGSVREGGRLIDFIRAVDKKVICVADIAASMAFAILQSCHERYAMRASIPVSYTHLTLPTIYSV